MTRSVPPMLALVARLAIGGAALGLAGACTTLSGGQDGGGLTPALTARMDTGASLDRGAALDLVNAYRATLGAAPLERDAGLDATAQALAETYAGTGSAPRNPEGVAAIRLSAGYQTFAETFSGWRNSPADARVLGLASARRGGLAVVDNPASTYGVYWVLVLDD